MASHSVMDYQEFLEEVQQKICDLEQGIRDVAEVKSKLKATASEVKMHIRESISRQLEALRNREVWLVNQVEIIQNIKEEILRQQHADLNQGLGQLAGAHSLLQQAVPSGCGLDLQSLHDQIGEVLRALEYISLHPDESSKISFVADNFNLLQAITQYGRVGDSDSAMEQKIASSLQELKLDPPVGKGSKWLIGHHQGDVDDWHFQSQSDISADEFILVAKGDHDLAHSELSSEIESVEVDVGEKELPVLQHLCTIKESDLSKWLLHCDSSEEELPENPLTKTYQDIRATDMEKWLVKNVTRGSAGDAIEVYQQICNSDMNMWLKETQPSPKEIVASPLTTYSSIMMSKKEKWLRDSEMPESDTKCVVQKYVDIANSDLEQWLSPQSGNSDTEVKSESMFPEQSDDPADWLLRRDSEATTVPVAKIPGFKDSSCDQEKWLVRPMSSESMENLKAKDLEKWLFNAQKKKSSEPYDPSRVVTSYLESIPSDYNYWLANPKPSPDLCKWLSHQSSSPCKNCPQANMGSNTSLFPVFDAVSNSSSGWLLTDW